MSYNSVGGITQKAQVHKSKDQEQKKTTYDLNYTYGEEQPHAPIHIGDQTYSYDANGNQTGWTDDKTGQRRDIMWDEENRIRSIYDNGSQHHYIYDASGERVLKGKSTGQRIFVNGEWKAGSGGMGNYTVYVNPYLVLTSGGYSKHYYIEGQRIVSKLGGGWDNTKNIKAGGDKVDYNGKTQKIFDGIVKNLKFLGADGQILTAGKSRKIPPGQLNGTATGNVSEAFRYFYRPDLPMAIGMGSTSYVTDASGEVYQHLEYFAFGETFVEEHSNTDRTPYLFNGKELDEETGLYYYGARYYDARTSVWQSVDPAAEEFVGISPYVYTANNPIILTDPDGKRFYFSAGAGHDPDNTGYIKSFIDNMRNEGIKNVRDIDAHKRPILGVPVDAIWATGEYSQKPYYDIDHDQPIEMGVSVPTKVTTGPLGTINSRISSTVDQIKNDLNNNPLGKGEQFNLSGYSTGAVIMAQTALVLAKEGKTIDNLILIGAPFTKDSDLFKALASNENIKNIIRIDIPGDNVTKGRGAMKRFMKQGDNHPHFKFAFHKNAAKNQKELAKYLKSLGVE
jgi:RHS repeat-associated protein